VTFAVALMTFLISADYECWNFRLSEMATVVDKANAYFSSISSLAARVFADVDLVKQACVASGEWEELSVEDQELLTDQVLIDSQVLDRYSSSTVDCDNYEDCFPVLKVNSGEKIIVDFDQDDVRTNVVVACYLLRYTVCNHCDIPVCTTDGII